VPRTRYDVDRRGRDGATPLCEACWSGHVDVARLLLEHGAVVHGGDYRYTPLLLACRNGRADAAALLFDRGADNRASPEGLTPLYRACQYGHTKAALLCLDRGADVDQTAFGMTPFYIACAKGHVDAARLCLERGAFLWFRARINRDTSRTPYQAARFHRYEAMAAWLARVEAVGWAHYLSEPRYALVVLRELVSRRRAQRPREFTGKERVLEFLFPGDQTLIQAPRLPNELVPRVLRY